MKVPDLGPVFPSVQKGGKLVTLSLVRWGAVVWKYNEIKSEHVLYNCRVWSPWQG